MLPDALRPNTPLRLSFIPGAPYARGGDALLRRIDRSRPNKYQVLVQWPSGDMTWEEDARCYAFVAPASRYPSPSVDAVVIGDDVSIDHYVMDEADESCGVTIWHRNEAGESCAMDLHFQGTRGAKPQQITWHLVSREPLTVAPSVMCEACGFHGKIVDGKCIPIIAPDWMGP